MKPVHQLNDELLTAFAAGLIDAPLELLVRTHLSLNPAARREVNGLLAIGGGLLDAEEPAELSPELRDRVLKQLDVSAPAHLHNAVAVGDVPAPLVPYVGTEFSKARWRTFGSVSEIRLLPEADGYVTRLLKIRPGAGVPEHTHEGMEATVVIRGAFSDCTGRYGPGDVAMVDGELDHSPIAEAGEPCICLAVTDAPLRLTGRIGRFLNPFVRL